ncbi:HugZ family protein [Candidatus Puniceispirillum sp.]|jgi:heme iron utilization protein|uniref:HugZ family protein n=1 Tax=Candidatus Puniceispirillum sp. TaxID=2026719 RepID=UPI001ECEE3BD|nr:HugZ family protein [Candidatus Puniceispirillum sp.]MBT6566567.1 HugZ family protein [Candidatus Puniceispirillum sp.]
MDKNEMPALDHAGIKRDRDRLLNCKSLIVTTSLADKIPEIGTAPFIRHYNYLYIYSSHLSKHTRVLLETKKAQFMLCQDESDAQNIWARHRLKFTAHIVEIARDDASFPLLCDKFEAAFGSTMGLIRDFADFHMLRLEPFSGVLVLGFAKAFEVQGANFEIVSHLRSA